MIDVPVGIHTKDLAVVSEIIAELDHNSKRLAEYLERQRRDIADLKACVAEWRDRCV